MRCRVVGWVMDGVVILYTTYPSADWTYLEILKRTSHPKYINIPDIIHRDDGVWVVSGGGIVKEYTTKDALMVALVMQGVDVSELERVE